jgi:formylglycine-generating enzyme required for sulfatase activity
MPDESSVAPPAPDAAAAPEAMSVRRNKRRVLVACALLMLGLAGWYFGVELPERRATEKLRREQAKNARHIPDLNLDLVWIPPGTYRMGTPEQSALAKWFYDIRKKLTKKPSPSFYGEEPATWVILTRPFWLGRTEVTQAQWAVVMGNNPSNLKGEELPVENVSREDAMDFCRKLTERDRAAGRLPAGYAYTLPTEAQWEYACRAGTTGDYAGALDAMAWYGANSGGTTHPVGTKQTNAWGLHDMHGNVWEWCLDWSGDYRGGEVTNPRGLQSGTHRIYRGGSWHYVAASARSASRAGHSSDYSDDDLGFRLALAPASQTPASPAVSAP